MVSQILNKMDNLASSFLPSIQQIILSLLSTCVFALEHREKVSWYRWINTCVSEQVVHLGMRSVMSAILLLLWCSIHSVTRFIHVLVMQRFRLVYREISHDSLVFSGIHILVCIPENTSDELDIPRLYHEKGLHIDYFMPYHRKYTGRMERLGVINSWIALIDGKVRWNTDENTTAFLHSDWLYFLRHGMKRRFTCTTTYNVIATGPFKSRPLRAVCNPCPSIILYVVRKELGFIPCFMMWQRIWFIVWRVIFLLSNYCFNLMSKEWSK